MRTRHARPGASALLALLALSLMAAALSSCGPPTLVSGAAAAQTTTAAAVAALPSPSPAPTSPPTSTVEVHCPAPVTIPPEASPPDVKYRGRHCPDLVFAEWADNRGHREEWVARSAVTLTDATYDALPQADPVGVVPGVGVVQLHSLAVARRIAA